jgi:hypothetical protein
MRGAGQRKGARATDASGHRLSAPTGRRARTAWIWQGGTHNHQREHLMSIAWNHDFDPMLEHAGSADKPILLDFSAAPM